MTNQGHCRFDDDDEEGLATPPRWRRADGPRKRQPGGFVMASGGKLRESEKERNERGNDATNKDNLGKKRKLKGAAKLLSFLPCFFS